MNVFQIFQDDLKAQSFQETQISIPKDAIKALKKRKKSDANTQPDQVLKSLTTSESAVG